MRTARLAKLTLGIALVSILVGCTPLWNPRNVAPPPLKPDSQANFQALNAQLSDSCAAPILEPERSALIQEALADSQLQAVKAQLERRGLGMNADEAQAVQLVGGAQLLIPFGQDAHLVWTRTNGQTAAIGLVRQGNKTLNVGADGQERVVRVLSAQQAEKLLRKLREKSKFQEFEGKLAQKGKRVGKVWVLLDETNKLAIVGIAAEGSEKIAHQVRIKVKANKDDEPEDDAEPMIQATACGQATGEAVPTGARLQPLMLYAGEGGDVTTGSYTLIERDYGPQICTSQWGYVYDCRKITPILRVTPSSLVMPLAIIPDPVQASFTVWNYGGGTLRGTVTVSTPFSIVSGGSFSLLPGQPQEVVIRFTPATSGTFSQSATISSNGGNTAVSLTVRALTFEEYLDILVATHNAALQQGIGERAIYLQDSSRGLALYGFPQISRSELQGLWENFDELATGNNSLPPWVAQGLEILQSISDEQWRQWIWSLVMAERAGRFEEEYNRLLPLGLSTYLQGYQLLTNSNADQAKAQLHDFVRRLAATGANNLDSALAALPTLDQISTVVRVLSGQIVRAARETGRVRLLYIVNPDELIDRFVRAYELARLSYVGPGEQAQYDLDIFKILDFLANNPNRPGPETAFFAWMGLLNILEGLAGRAEPYRFPSAPRTTEERKALIRVVAQSIDNGWRLMGIQYIYQPYIGAPVYFFPLVVWDPNFRLRDGRVVRAIFGIGFFQVGPGFDPNRVLEWVAQAIQGFDSGLARSGVYFRMIGAVMVGQASIGQIGGMIDALRNAYNNWDGAIFVVWVDANGRVWFVCIGRGCDLLSPTQQQQNACMLAGQSPDCGAERYYSGGSTPGSSSSPVVQITP
jgi:hypothetical protein